MKIKQKHLNALGIILSLSGCFLLSGCNADTPSAKPSSDAESISTDTTTIDKSDTEKETSMTNKLIIQTDPKADGAHTMSDSLYGIFLEDINFAVDGGLYAELVKNRSFEYGDEAQRGKQHGWVVTNADTVQFEVKDGTDDQSYIASSNPSYAVLTNTSDEFAGLSNNGYLSGIAVTAQEDYNFSVFLRAPKGYSGTVKISLKDKSSGTVYAESTLEGISADWQQYNLTLTPNTTANSNVLLYVEIEQGTIYMDMVSLIPADTYHGLNIRKDIGEYLEALHPNFMRFPGGCVIEGKDEESIYSWKDSIGNGQTLEINGVTTTGNVAVRPQGKSIWSGNSQYPYYTTYGIGFYEYFLLCEELDCLPVPVLNAGMTCQVQSPKYIVYSTDSEEFQQYIQDALDLVEFCRGGADTTWGAVRIAMGHEEPFELKYIAIGNEQWQTEYYQHYALFVEAFEEAAKENPDLYDGIELIVANSTTSGDTVGWNYVNTHSEDTLTKLVDEHYYESADWFFSNTERYDKYDRSTTANVFLGEYAAQANTLYAALAEAAYMTGLERNSDVVQMACYAPLFANDVFNQWTPDMIWYGNDSVHGSINYYVQKLFSNNQGSTYLPATLEQAASEDYLHGRAGLGSWMTSVSYDNFKVVSNTTGETLCEYTFDDTEELNDWDELTGDWSIADGKLVQSNTADPVNTNCGDVMYVGDKNWSDYTLTVDATILDGNEGFLIPVALQDSNNNIFWNLGGWGNTVSCLQIVTSGTKSGQISGTTKNVKLNKNQTYQLKVVVNTDTIQCYLDDQLYVDYTYTSKSNLYQSCSLDENGDLIVKLVNSTDSVQTLNVTLKDFDADVFESTAATTTLSNEDASVSNTYKNPETVVPVESTYEISADFSYELPAYSLTILRIPAK